MKLIKHIVFLKIKEGINEERVKKCLDTITDLKDTIPGIISIDYGKDNSPEKKNKGYQYAFTVYFKDAASRDSYISHPDHQRVINEHITPIVSDVMVFDYGVN